MKKIYLYLKGQYEKIGNSSLKGKVLFFITGLAATIWFLARVIPKPSRAAYPCMQAAAPTMSAFVLYMLSLVGGVKAWNKLKESWHHRHYGIASISLVLLLICGISFWANYTDTSLAQILPNRNSVPSLCYPPNKYAGKATGIYPGRVVWAHAPGAASWTPGKGNWFEDQYNNQDYYDWLVKNALTELTGTRNEKKAWNALFASFNAQHAKTGSYAKGEKIVIEINQNNTYSQQDSKEINASPQMVLALLSSLVGPGGIPQECIIVTDPSRFVTDYLFKKCHTKFPKITFVDNMGGNGRTKSAYVADAIHYSQDNGQLARGISTDFIEADYVINVALLKGHVGQGSTLCGKNWYGVTNIDPDWRKNHHNNFDQDRNGKPKYMTFVDFMGHKDLGGKTILYLIDGAYGSKDVGGEPSGKWAMAPFNNNWPCSLLASQDAVAIDAVALDFLLSEFPNMADVNYSDMYLIEAALAGQAPSGCRYDPEGDGTTLKSLGVFEHWNNSSDKKYSRNLGKKEGIELVVATKILSEK